MKVPGQSVLSRLPAELVFVALSLFLVPSLAGLGGAREAWLKLQLIYENPEPEVMPLSWFLEHGSTRQWVVIKNAYVVRWGRAVIDGDLFPLLADPAGTESSLFLATSALKPIYGTDGTGNIITLDGDMGEPAWNSKTGAFDFPKYQGPAPRDFEGMVYSAYRVPYWTDRGNFEKRLQKIRDTGVSHPQILYPESRPPAVDSVLWPAGLCLFSIAASCWLGLHLAFRSPKD